MPRDPPVTRAVRPARERETPASSDRETAGLCAVECVWALGIESDFFIPLYCIRVDLADIGE
jgi:hypothetical protein